MYLFGEFDFRNSKVTTYKSSLRLEPEKNRRPSSTRSVMNMRCNDCTDKPRKSYFGQRSVICFRILDCHLTMLKKLSKCEVKVWNLIILPPLRFYVKSNFRKFKLSKNVIFGNFRGSEFFEQLSSPKFIKIQSSESHKIAKKDIFTPFDFTKIWFHVKLE